jgi:hypothetical protein
MENNAIKRSASVIDRILKILQGFLIAAAAVCAIFIPLVAILGEKMVAGASTLKLGVLSLDLVGDGMQFVDKAALKPVIICELAAIILAVAAGWYFIRVLRSILATMKEGRPFESGVSEKISKLGWTALIGGAVVEVVSKLSPFLDAKCYDLTRIFNSDAVEGVSFNFGANVIWFIVVALVLFFLSYVFKCGEELQKESDETL